MSPPTASRVGLVALSIVALVLSLLLVEQRERAAVTATEAAQLREWLRGARDETSELQASLREVRSQLQHGHRDGRSLSEARGAQRRGQTGVQHSNQLENTRLRSELSAANDKLAAVTQQLRAGLAGMRSAEQTAHALLETAHSATDSNAGLPEGAPFASAQQQLQPPVAALPTATRVAATKQCAGAAHSNIMPPQITPPQHCTCDAPIGNAMLRHREAQQNEVSAWRAAGALGERALIALYAFAASAKHGANTVYDGTTSWTPSMADPVSAASLSSLERVTAPLRSRVMLMACPHLNHKRKRVL